MVGVAAAAAFAGAALGRAAVLEKARAADDGAWRRGSRRGHCQQTWSRAPLRSGRSTGGRILRLPAAHHALVVGSIGGEELRGFGDTGVGVDGSVHVEFALVLAAAELLSFATCRWGVQWLLPGR